MFRTRVAGKILLFTFVFSTAAHAYPENIRHRYINCNSCHVSPNGAGLLNPYGRQLSKAVQSYGKFFFEPSPSALASKVAPTEIGNDRDPETEFLYGAFPQPSWLNLGGDLRFLQLYQDTPAFTQARFIVMQLDLEAAVTFRRLTAVATLGRIDPADYGRTNPGFSDYILSRRHYLLYQATDEIHLMAGRFGKSFGINDPNHVSLVKRGLGWDYGSESYNIQAGYLGETYNLVGYADLGRPADPGNAPIEKGGGLQISRAVGDSYKLGLSYFYGYTDTQQRHVYGPWALLGFTEHFYLRTEQDFFTTLAVPSGPSTTGYGSDTRLGYELVQGFHAFLEQQYLDSDLTQTAAQRQVYGVGLLYYPRTHWEFEADFQKNRLAQQDFNTYVYFLFHYYL